MQRQAQFVLFLTQLPHPNILVQQNALLVQQALRLLLVLVQMITLLTPGEGVVHVVVVLVVHHTVVLVLVHLVVRLDPALRVITTAHTYAVVANDVSILHQCEHTHFAQEFPILHVSLSQQDFFDLGLIASALSHSILHAVPAARAQINASKPASSNHRIHDEIGLETTH